MSLTPMMAQYKQIRAHNPDALLFFRLGDFYELFFDDAVTASRELDLTLTGKECGLEERAPMCGVPYHSVDVYIAKLIEKGYHVAICDQVSDPALSKGLVDREVTRVITPGTLIEANMLDERRPNYIMSLYIKGGRAGTAFCDISTGEFFAYEFANPSARANDELARAAPRELILNDEALFKSLAIGAAISISPCGAELFEYGAAATALTSHFTDSSISSLGLGRMKLAVSAAGALISHLQKTQKCALNHILGISLYNPAQYMALDAVAKKNLELTETISGRARAGSLMGVIDMTLTSMGSRALRSWVEQPLCDAGSIERRLDAVSRLKDSPIERQELRDAFAPVRDIERLLSRIAYENISPRDCLGLANSLGALPGMRKPLANMREDALGELYDMLEPMGDIVNLLTASINPDTPVSIRDGGIIRDGYNAELDDLRRVSIDGKSWISALERQERELTGIKNLKISYNRVFGFYIEVTKSNYASVPMHYIRKQTLAASERYVTQDLKDLEKKVLGAEDSAARLEHKLYAEIKQKLLMNISRLSRAAQALKTLDALSSLAQAAAVLNYTRPVINERGEYHIKNGRHPVVEQSIGRETFVPNDTHIDADERVMIITGPNMAGKSTYMRQVALITLMAHAGSFVPAEEADIALTDRIFTRVGASDDLYGGQSTFMVEMTEMANILKYATPNSLMILDEVGRGTSTFDGLSIAWAAVEHIANIDKCGSRALFATHYHELSELEGKLDGVVNYRITAKEKGDEVVFLRQIVRGGADRSFGVAVAGLAGLPSSLIARARQIMARIEVDGQKKGSIGQSILAEKGAGNRQVGLHEFEPMELVEEIRGLDVLGMSPMEALNALFTLVEKARRI